MKPTHTSLRWRTLLAGVALLPATTFGQSAPAGTSSSTQSSGASGGTGEAIVLSPFAVSSEADEGYYASASVSGTRTRTELENLPLSMQVFTDQFIRDVGARDLIDVLVFGSGISVGSGQATNDGDNTSVTIRGQVSFVPMRNGFRRLRTVAAANIDRVEIIKGPASLLYGQLNPGGNMNYITKRPQPTRRIAEVSATVGSYEYYRGTGDFNVPIIPKKLALRLTGSYEDSQSIVARYNNITDLINPSLTWWIRPDTSLTVEYERTRRHINAPKSGIPFHPRVRFNDAGYAVDRTWNTHTSQDYTDTDMTTRTAEFVHRFAPSLLLRANVTKSVWYDDVKRNGSNINIVSDAAGNPTDLLPVRTIGFGRRGSWDQWKQFELVNNFTWRGIEAQNIVGYQHEILEFRQVLATTQAAPSTGVQWNLRNPATWNLTNLMPSDTAVGGGTGTFSTNVTHSYYFANQLSFLEGRLRTLAGLRYDKFRVFSFVPNANPQRAESRAEPAKIPQAGVLFKLNRQLSLYATYSESFLPVFNSGRRPDGTFFSPGPQSGKGMDLGVKWQMFNGRLSGTAAVFRVDNTDIVRFLPSVTVQTPTGPETFSPLEQSGTDRSEGFELDGIFRVSKATQLTFSYSYTDAWVKSDNAARATLPGGVVYFTRTEHWLQNAPRHTATTYLRHEFGAFAGFKNTWVTGGGRYYSDRVFTETYNVIAGVPTPPPVYPSYAVFNLGVGGRFTLGGRDYDVSVQAKNIFDRVYLENRFHYGLPRTIEATFVARF